MDFLSAHSALKWDIRNINLLDEIGPPCIDTREIKTGDVFWALKGQRDGGEFAENALRNGAQAVVVTKDWASKLPETSKIVVVDNDSGIRKLTVDALSYCVNRDVVSFGNGRAAWDYFEDGNAADLVIADADLPDMDGLALLKRFKLRWKERIFICMSDRPESGTVAEAAGADAFLVKPFTINDLFRIVQEYVVGA